MKAVSWTVGDLPSKAYRGMGGRYRRARSTTMERVRFGLAVAVSLVLAACGSGGHRAGPLATGASTTSAPAETSTTATPTSGAPARTAAPTTTVRRPGNGSASTTTAAP